MRIQLDENLLYRLAAKLKTFGHDVHTAYDENLRGRSDEQLWATAQQESRFLITQDLDFSDSRRFAPGSHEGILVLRLRSPSCENLSARIEELFSQESIEGWKKCFVLATERKIRALKPKTP